MIIQPFIEPPLDNNNYVVIDEVSHQAALIDCSAPDDSIMDFIRAHDATLKFILITHAHLDHVMGVTYFQQHYDAKAYLYQKDEALLADINKWTARLGWPPVTEPHADVLTDDSTQLTLGQHSIQIIPTPGHTQGGVSYLIDNYLFSGDTLFRGTHGRVDLPGSNPSDMRNSLQKLMQLSGDIVVYPGHGAPTTIAEERKNFPIDK